MPADRGHWWVVVGVLRQGAAQVECPASGSSPGVLIGVGELVKAGLEGSATFGVEDHPCGREVSRRITTVQITEVDHSRQSFFTGPRLRPEQDVRGVRVAMDPCRRTGQGRSRDEFVPEAKQDIAVGNHSACQPRPYVGVAHRQRYSTDRAARCIGRRRRVQLGHEAGQLRGNAAPLSGRHLGGRPAVEPATDRPRPGIIRARDSTSHRHGYPRGYLLSEDREPALLVNEQIDRYLSAWEPYTQVVAQAIEHVVPTIGNQFERAG